MKIILSIITGIFCLVPFVGSWSLLAGVFLVTIALSLIDVLNEKYGLLAAQRAAVISLAFRIAFFMIISYFGLVSGRVAHLFTAGILALGLSQIFLDAPLFWLIKRTFPKTGFVTRNLVSNCLNAAAFVIFSGGSAAVVLAAIGMRVGYSLLLSPFMLMTVRALPLLLLLPTNVDAAELKANLSLRLTEPSHFETLANASYGRLWVQNLMLIDPEYTVPWNNKTTLGIVAYSWKHASISVIGQYQVWDLETRVGTVRNDALRYGIEVVIRK